MLLMLNKKTDSMDQCSPSAGQGSGKQETFEKVQGVAWYLSVQNA